MSYFKSMLIERDALVEARDKYAKAAGIKNPTGAMKATGGGMLTDEQKTILDFNGQISRKNAAIERYASVVKSEDPDSETARGEAAVIHAQRKSDTRALNEQVKAAFNGGSQISERTKRAGRQDRFAKSINSALFGGIAVDDTGLMPSKGKFFDSDGLDADAKAINALNVRAGSRQIPIGRRNDGGEIVLLPEFGGTLVGLMNRPNLIGSEIYRFYRQTSREDAAAEFVPKRGQKPEAGFGYEAIDDRVRTLAVLSEPIPTQDLADLPRLREDVGRELANRIIWRLEDAMLRGQQTNVDDAGREMFNGILNTPGVREQAYMVSPYRTIRRSLTVLESAGYDPTNLAIALNPLTWEALETEVDNEGRPLFSGLYTSRQDPVLFGRPVVLSNRLGEGEAIVGDWAQAMLTLRSDIELSWSDGGDLFETNTVRFRADLRAGFNLSQPGAFVHAALESTGG